MQEHKEEGHGASKCLGQSEGARREGKLQGQCVCTPRVII